MNLISHTVTDVGRIAVVRINGALNSNTSVNFEEYINRLLKEGKHYIILDASNLEYISSAGIGVMIFIRSKILEHNGLFIICNLSGEVSSLYSMLGFDVIFDIVGSEDKALLKMEAQIEAAGHHVDHGDDETIQDIMTHDDITSEDDTDMIEFNFQDTIIDDADEKTSFADPIILECAECKSLIRILKSGTYICPDCKSEFSVDKDQTVIF